MFSCSLPVLMPSWFYVCCFGTSCSRKLTKLALRFNLLGHPGTWNSRYSTIALTLISPRFLFVAARCAEAWPPLFPHALHEGNVKIERHGSTTKFWIINQIYKNVLVRGCGSWRVSLNFRIYCCSRVYFLACLFLRVYVSLLIAICRLFVGVCDYLASACLFFVSMSCPCLKCRVYFLCCRV